MATRLIERVSSDASLRVDRAAGVIRGVRVLGLVSANGRRYDPRAVAAAKGMYEGARVFYDHNGEVAKDRSVTDQAGWLENVRIDQDGGLRGDLHILTSDPRGPKILETAEKAPHMIGLSHNAEGRTRIDPSGNTVVEEIYAVHSVDLVSYPATTRGLFEGAVRSVSSRPARCYVPPATAAEFCHSLQEGATIMPSDTINSDTLASDAIKERFLQAISAVVSDATLSDAQIIQKVRGLLRVRSKALTTAGDVDAAIADAMKGVSDGTTDATTTPGTPTAESRRFFDGLPIVESSAAEQFARSLRR